MMVLYTWLSLLWAEPQTSNGSNQPSSSIHKFPPKGSSFQFVLDDGIYSYVGGSLSILKVSDGSACLQYEGGGKSISDFNLTGCIDCTNNTSSMELPMEWTEEGAYDTKPYEESLADRLIEWTCNGTLYSKFERHLEGNKYGYKRESKCDYTLMGVCGYNTSTDCTYHTFGKKLTKVEYNTGAFTVKADCTWTSSKHYCVYEDGTVENLPTEQDSPWCITGGGRGSNNCVIEMCPYISGFDLK